MIKISFTPEFLEWVTLQMRANDTGLDARQFATEFFHRAFVGRGSEVLAAAPLLLALLTEPIPDGKGKTFADNLDVIAGLVGHLGYDWTERAIREKAQAIRAAIAAVRGE